MTLNITQELRRIAKVCEQAADALGSPQRTSTMSQAMRRRLSRAQRERWAKVRQAKVAPINRKKAA
jgi:hypothetical protein